MKPTALIIFVKEPVAGKVKTRLAADIGNERALRVYERLLAHTDSITQGFERFIFYAGKQENIQHFQKESDVFIAQTNGDLGDRMLTAFELLHSKGYKRIMIIGSDCAELTNQIIHQAADALQEADACIGPALDGGYYLLGLREPIGEIFRDMPWSTDRVAEITQERLRGKSVSLLPVLRDIDHEADLQAVGWECD